MSKGLSTKIIILTIDKSATKSTVADTFYFVADLSPVLATVNCRQNGNNLNIYESLDDPVAMTSFRYNGRRKCDFSISFDNYSCCKERSPTQSVMLGARLDAAQATVYKLTLTKRSSLIFMKFRLCRCSV